MEEMLIEGGSKLVGKRGQFSMGIFSINEIKSSHSNKTMEEIIALSMLIGENLVKNELKRDLKKQEIIIRDD